MSIQLGTIHCSVWLVGLIAASAISIVSKKLNLLTFGGAIAASIIGTCIFSAGSLGLTTALIWFFVSSSLLGRFRKSRKASMGYAKPGARDAWQVLANGSVAAALACTASIFPHIAAQLKYASLGAISSAAADTWATEVGSAFGASTYLLTTLKRVPSGRSGGVSLPGSIAAAIGAILTSAIGFGLGGMDKTSTYSVAVWIALPVCAILGCIIDSVLGATLQAQFQTADGAIVENEIDGLTLVQGVRFVTNDVVNFPSVAASALIAYAVYRALIAN